MPTQTDRANFQVNLRYLCQHKKSASKIARDVGINRQQFEKYLSGRSFPSQNTFFRLSGYFGIPQDTLLAAPETFANARHEFVAISEQRTFEFSRSTAQEMGILRDYVGSYQIYFLTPAWPGRISSGLVVVSEQDRQLKTRFFNRTRDPKTGALYRSRLEGRIVLRDDRLFQLEKTSEDQNRFSETILFPAHTPRARYLTGMSLGVSWRPHRMPFATRVIWRRHPQMYDLRAAMRDCGIYQQDAKQIDPIVRKFFGPDPAVYAMSEGAPM